MIIVSDDRWIDWLYSLKPEDYVKYNGKVVRLAYNPFYPSLTRFSLTINLGDKQITVPSIDLSPLSPLEALGAQGKDIE